VHWSLQVPVVHWSLQVPWVQWSLQVPWVQWSLPLVHRLRLSSGKFFVVLIFSGQSSYSLSF